MRALFVRMTALALIVAALAFVLSASAGLGGSLLLVPAMAAMFGVKQGIALAALLLAGNNLAKVVAYRRVVPLRAVALLLTATVVGATAGAGLLVCLPARCVAAAVVIGIVATLALEQLAPRRVARRLAPWLALGGGAASGVSGTSGPLKGLAIRSLGIDRRKTVGAASALSLAGDAAKVAVLANADLLPSQSTSLLVLALPVMVAATWLGRRVNQRIGERGYAVLFWSVMAGYALRLLA